MYQTLLECDDRPDIIKLGQNNICKMNYSKTDSKDLWIGYELGGETLQTLVFNVKGTFHNGQRMYSIEHQQFYNDVCFNSLLLKDLLKRIIHALYYLSKLRLVHADMKSENILIN